MDRPLPTYVTMDKAYSIAAKQQNRIDLYELIGSDFAKGNRQRIHAKIIVVIHI